MPWLPTDGADRSGNLACAHTSLASAKISLALPSSHRHHRQGHRHQAATDTCPHEQPSTAQPHAAPAPSARGTPPREPRPPQPGPHGRSPDGWRHQHRKTQSPHSCQRAYSPQKRHSTWLRRKAHLPRSGRRASRPVGRFCAPAHAGRRPSIWDCRYRQPRAVYPRASGGPPSSTRAGNAPRRTRFPLDLAPGGVYQAAQVTPSAGGLLHHARPASDLHRTTTHAVLRALSGE
jgi:hypothetical protein